MARRKIVNLQNFTRELKREFDNIETSLKRAMDAGANASRKLVKEQTPEDSGELKKGWGVERSTSGVDLVNDAPHAGIVEQGARPHPVSRQGRARLAVWVRTKLGVTDPIQARKIANKIANKIKVRGQKPTFFVRVMLPMMTRSVMVKFEQRLRKAAK